MARRVERKKEGGATVPSIPCPSKRKFPLRIPSFLHSRGYIWNMQVKLSDRKLSRIAHRPHGPTKMTASAAQYIDKGALGELAWQRAFSGLAAPACSPALVYLDIPKCASEASYEFVFRACGTSIGRFRGSEHTREGMNCPRWLCSRAAVVHSMGGHLTSDRLCFTMLRNPLARFYASYAELSERAVKWHDLNDATRRAGPGEAACSPNGTRCCVCDARCSCYRSIARSGAWARQTAVEQRVLGLLELLERVGFFDEHVHPQTNFLRRGTHSRASSNEAVCSRLDAVGHVEDAAATFRALAARLRSAHWEQPWEAARSHARSAMPAAYLTHHYMDTTLLSARVQAEVALRVCRLYQSDYCLLRAYLSPPPVCVRAGLLTAGACAAAGFAPPANLSRSLIGPEVRFVDRMAPAQLWPRLRGDG